MVAVNLLSSIIEKQLEIKDFYLLRKFYSRAFYKFYQAYAISIAFLTIQDKLEINNIELNKRMRLYKKLIIKKEVTDKDLKKFNYLTNKDFKIINYAMQELEKIESNINAYGSYYRPGRVAVDTDEFPSN